MDPNNRLKPVRDPGKKTKNSLELLDTKIKRQKPVSTSLAHRAEMLGDSFT